MHKSHESPIFSDRLQLSSFKAYEASMIPVQANFLRYAYMCTALTHYTKRGTEKEIKSGKVKRKKASRGSPETVERCT